MATIPKMSLVNRIDAVEILEFPRPHLGASIIGEPCGRKVVYSYFWAHKNKIGAKLHRIFRTGDFVETQIVAALESIGLKVVEAQARVYDSTGHASGSIDGIVTGHDLADRILLEAKSMNHTNYLEAVRSGVHKANHKHYVQMQMYMGRLGLELAMYIILDKNTCDLNVEFVPFDIDCFDKYQDMEQSVLTANHINEFPRISSNSSWFQCKMCDAKGLCHGGDSVERNCRTCDHSTMISNGGWGCTFHNKTLSTEAQIVGCDNFKLGAMWK
jgi:hypothetical protein